MPFLTISWSSAIRIRGAIPASPVKGCTNGAEVCIRKSMYRLPMVNHVFSISGFADFDPFDNRDQGPLRREIGTSYVSTASFTAFFITFLTMTFTVSFTLPSLITSSPASATTFFTAFFTVAATGRRS